VPTTELRSQDGSLLELSVTRYDSGTGLPYYEASENRGDYQCQFGRR
jgi:hypothetical protein